jgi:hypothetical protein
VENINYGGGELFADRRRQPLMRAIQTRQSAANRARYVWDQFARITRPCCWFNLKLC